MTEAQENCYTCHHFCDDDGYGFCHLKGITIDEESALIGCVCWMEPFLITGIADE